MLLDMAQGFKKLYDKEGDAVISEQYALKKGLYILVNDNGIKDSMFIEDNNNVPEDKEELFNYIKIRDYLSILKQYDTNKCVSGKAKSIHSNNFLTLFIREKKAKPIIKNSTVNPVIKEQIKMYFKQFLIWKEEELIAKKNLNINKPKEFILTKTKEFNEDLFNNSKAAIMDLLITLPKMLEKYELKDNDYIRVFYETAIANYDIEYRRYMIRKIFNKDKYHLFKNDDVYGISGIELNNNSNKPSLILKSMRTEIPLRLNFDTLLMVQKLYEFLWFYKVPRYNKKLDKTEYVSTITKRLFIPLDFDINGLDLTQYNNLGKPVYYVATGNGEEFNIVDYDILYPFDTDIDLTIEDYFKEKEEEKEENIQLNSLVDLESLVNKVFFNFNLVKNYHSEKISSNSSDKFSLPNNLVCILNSSRYVFHDWFRKGTDLGIVKPLTKTMNEIIAIWADSEEITTIRIKDMLNLKWAIIDYLNEREGEAPLNLREYLDEIRSDLRVKINDKSDTENYIYDTEEFYYACGQLIYYLLTQNKKNFKKHQTISKFLQCKTSSKLKSEIAKLCVEVTVNISAYNYRFKNLYSMIVTFNEKSNAQEYIDYLQAGIYQSSLMYEKSKKEKLKYDDNITIF